MNENLIKKYCGDIEERITACRSRKVAEQLKKFLCAQLKMHCQDEFVNKELKTRLDELINKYFTDDGQNRLIKS